MKRIALMAALLLCGLLAWAQQKPEPAPPAHEIKMTAKKYEFSPAEIRVKQGERVRLLITATDRKHGFQIEALGLKTELPEGKETAVEFTAPKPGAYEFKCSVRCGWRHGSMKGRLIVEPAPAN